MPLPTRQLHQELVDFFRCIKKRGEREREREPEADRRQLFVIFDLPAIDPRFLVDTLSNDGYRANQSTSV